MNAATKENLNGKVEVPAWVLAVTYVLCWGFAVAVMVEFRAPAHCSPLRWFSRFSSQVGA